MQQTPYEKWLNYSVYLLSLKMRTKHELLTRLEEKQVDSETIQLVLSFLEEHHYIDDEHYAALYIENHMSQHGPYRMKQKLRQKGISASIIEEAFETLETYDEYDEAKSVLVKKMKTLTIDWECLHEDYAYKQKIYQKCARFLAYRGFSAGLINSVISDCLSEEFFDEL